VEWNGQEEAGLLMIKAQQSLAISIVMDQVIAEGRSEASLSLWSEAQRSLENSHVQT
jgi:hypothetical protein